MNEKIRQLAEEAEKYANEQAQRAWHHSSGFNPFKEKFAELIVRECLAHGKLTQSQAVVNGSEEYNAGREMGIEVFMNQIKQHFGVEE